MTQDLIIARIQAVLVEIAEHEGEEPEPGPRPPAPESAVAEAQRIRGGGFSPAYLDFLHRHDGWPDFPWGMTLFGTGELTDEDAYPYYRESLEDSGAPEELTDGLVVGASQNDPSLVLLLDSGEVVDFLYEERERFPDFGAYLANALAAVEGYRAQLLAHEQAAQADWTPAHREAKEAHLLDELRRRASAPPLATAPVGAMPAAQNPMPPAVEAGDLVVGKKKAKASVMLSLVLYLGSYPSPDEVLGCFRAFRRRFPVDGVMEWAAPNEFGGFPEDAEHPDDESWAPQLRVDVGGHFGIRVSIEAKAEQKAEAKQKAEARAKAERRYILNVRGVPPTSDGTRPQASFCEVIVPVDEDPERLAALADELTGLLPVRSGHGGYSAYVWDSDATEDSYRHVFSWCRRFFGLGVGYVDGWLEAATERVVGADWLTVLGPSFATYLADHAPPTFTPPRITVTRSPHGLVIRAGERPTLGDVHRGEFPVALAEIDHYLLPLKTGTWGYTSTWWFTPGRAWHLTYDELPGGFTDHRATSTWLTRFLDPQRFLGPTAVERGEELLSRLSRHHGKDWADQWRARPTGFGRLLVLLTNAARPGEASDTSVAALEFVVSFPDDAPVEAFNRLLHAYLLRDDLARAQQFLSTALEHAPRLPDIFHNAACVAARGGDRGLALELIRAAKASGYSGLAAMREDEALRGLHGDPVFTAAFAQRGEVRRPERD